MRERGVSPLHAARAPVAAAYACALVTAALAFEHPLVLTAIGVAILAAGMLAGVGRQLLRACVFGVPFAVMIALVNPLVAREGLDVVLRLGELGPLGRLDVTQQSLTFGAILGARALLVVLAGAALLAATVDADELLRRFRGISAQSALTAALAVRLVPVLGRDARRLADARRCRPGASAAAGALGSLERLQIVRAVATGALDRALDVAATLEVRGYASPAARGRPGRVREPWSRHDFSVLAAAVGLLALAGGARLLGMASFEAYPQTLAPVGAAEWVLCGALVVVALAPFADRRGVLR
jgi:energy-coupling factor transport system permease protein